MIHVHNSSRYTYQSQVERQLRKQGWNDRFFPSPHGKPVRVMINTGALGAAYATVSWWPATGRSAKTIRHNKLKESTRAFAARITAAAREGRADQALARKAQEAVARAQKDAKRRREKALKALCKAMPYFKREKYSDFVGATGWGSQGASYVEITPRGDGHALNVEVTFAAPGVLEAKNWLFCHNLLEELSR